MEKEDIMDDVMEEEVGDLKERGRSIGRNMAKMSTSKMGIDGDDSSKHRRRRKRRGLIAKEADEMMEKNRKKQAFINKEGRRGRGGGQRRRQMDRMDTIFEEYYYPYEWMALNKDIGKVRKEGRGGRGQGGR